MRKPFAIVGLAALTVAGLLAALALAPAASAWSPTQLPPGWAVGSVVTLNTTYCAQAYRIWTADRSKVSPAFCTDSPTYQQDFDAWVDARYTAPVTTSATSTQADTTATATTAAVTTAPTTTDPPPQTNPTTTTTPGCDLQCQIDAINVQLVQLRSELTKLEQILESWPNIDPGILAQLMSLNPPA